jgi:hypothetical protein
MKSIQIRNGVIHIPESNAVCPHCKVEITFDQIELKWIKCLRNYMTMKHNCGKVIGITQDIIGDFVAFKLAPTKTVVK